MLIYHLYGKGQLDKPNLVLMDSHYSHVFNYCYMQMMFSRNIKVFAIESHASQWGQPLDKNPFSGFKDAFHDELKKFNHKAAGRAITKGEFFQVFNVAWERAMTPKAIKAGYKRTGIWPVNRQAIPNYVREPSKLSESFTVEMFPFNCFSIFTFCLYFAVVLQCP